MLLPHEIPYISSSTWLYLEVWLKKRLKNEKAAKKNLAALGSLEIICFYAVATICFFIAVLFSFLSACNLRDRMACIGNMFETCLKHARDIFQACQKYV
jgi:uroporphyrinogen-III synthase